jgi:hypothetical protein
LSADGSKPIPQIFDTAIESPFGKQRRLFRRGFYSLDRGKYVCKEFIDENIERAIDD